MTLRPITIAVLTLPWALLAAEQPAAAGDKERLEPGDITKGMNAMRPHFDACHTDHPAAGKVVLKVKVRPAGAVKNVSVAETPSADLGRCIARSMRHARFAATKNGGSFTYPLVFRSKGDEGGDDRAAEPKDELSRTDILSAMRALRGKIKECGDAHPQKGQVKVAVKVTPAGSVADATVKSAPSEVLGTCVARAVKSASFPETKKGATFTYPFLFR